MDYSIEICKNSYQMSRKKAAKGVVAIASVSLDSIGGIEVYVKNLAQGLFKRGLRVHCIATNKRGDAFGKITEGIECHDLSPVPLSPRKIFTAAHLVNRICPNVLLLNNCSLMHYALPLLYPSIKPIAVLHSDDNRFYSVAALFSPRNFRWIAPTSGVKKAFQKYLPPDRWRDIRVIPHGVSEEFFQPALAKGDGRPTITFVGYIAENKGADLLPEIMCQVAAHYPEARLNVVGYGPLVEKLQLKFSEIGLSGQCVFTGPLAPEKVASILGASNIFLLPTRIEGFGLSIVEAMMSGAVPVVSKIRGITDDIVDDTITGLLVEIDDTKGFADAIISLLKNPEELISMSKAAREVAASRYSAEKMLDAYEALFEEEDDRQEREQSSRAEWFTELLVEVLRTSSYRDLLKKVKYLLR